MRNPVRLKNLRLRFLPFYAAGIAGLVWLEPTALGLGAGVVLMLCGAALRTWGAGHLVKNDQLTLTGPYAHVRHPLYLGSLLIGIGFAIGLGGWVAVAFLLLLLPWFFLKYFPRKDRIEAARLEEIYGDSFRRYRDAVPALVPRLRAWSPPEAPIERWSPRRYDGNNELGTALALAAGIGALLLRTMIPL